jgi:hypothetical protein
MALEIAQHGWAFVALASPLLVFTHTPLHDLEPLLWMAVWSLVQRPIRAGEEQITREQDSQYRHIFQYDAQTSMASGKQMFLLEFNFRTVLRLSAVLAKNNPKLEALKPFIVKFVESIRNSNMNLHQEEQLHPHAYSDGQAPLQIARCIRDLRLPDSEDVALGRGDTRVRTAEAALGKDERPTKKATRE